MHHLSDSMLVYSSQTEHYYSPEFAPFEIEKQKDGHSYQGVEVVHMLVFDLAHAHASNP